MFRKILHSVLAASIALTPIGASASDQFMFRYRTDIGLVDATPRPPTDEAEYGIGNDIVAYYVAPIGYAFTKQIPVATQDVVNWRKDSGEVPAGIDLDESSGVFAGEPTEEGPEAALFHGYDAGGNRIARAEIHFTVFEPVGVPSVVDFYAHTGTYFYGEIPNPEGVTVHTWSPIVPYADGMSMMNSALQGVPETAGTWGVAWRGYDYLGREVAFAYGDFLVEDGPVVEEVAGADIRRVFRDQVADKTRNESFKVTPTVRRALGPVTYRLVPVTARPAGLSFSSATGTIGGVHDEFETSAAFRIEARDSYDGTTGLSNAFTLTTLPANVDISSMPNLNGTVGTKYYRKLTAANLVAGAEWAVLQGALPEGLRLDGTTGVISGTPTKTEIQAGIVVAVSGPGMTAAQSGEFQFRIYPEPLEGTTEPLHVRVGTPFATAGVVVTSGGSEGYAVAAGTLPGDLVLDEDTGILSSSAGLPQAGDYDQLLTVTNVGRRRPLWQILRAYNPLAVSYEDHEVTRHEWFSKFPSTTPNSVIGAATYTIVDTDGDPLPDWLFFSRSTGRLYGSPTATATADVTYGPYVVTLKDELNEARSTPFTIRVNERPAVELTIYDQDVQRYVGNGYRVARARNARGGATYELVSVPPNWPSTLRVTSDGWLSGRTEDPVGTVYPGLVARVTDGEGFVSTSDPFDLTVLEPESMATLYGSLNATLEWTEGQPFSGRLPQIRNSYGAVVYAFDVPSSEVTITDPATGAWSGTAGVAGTRTLGFTVDDDTDRDPAKGTLTLQINPAPTAEAKGKYDLHRAARFDQVIPMVTGGTKPLTYILQGYLPAGLFFSGGSFTGTPLEEGDFPITVTVTDRAGSTTASSFILKVGMPLPLMISYDDSNLYYGKSGANGVLKTPTVDNALGAVTWSPEVGTLPQGVAFAKVGAYAGRFVGTPAETGRFPGIVITATDREGRVATTTVDLVVSRTGDIGFEDVTIRHRMGTPFSDKLVVTNAVDPVTFTSTDPAGLPNELVLNGSLGTITGTFAEEGVFPVGVTAADDMGRSASAAVTYEIVGDLEVAAADVALMQYVAASRSGAVTVANAVGQISFDLAAGTLPAGLSIDSLTGAIAGPTDEAGIFEGIVIEATDADGATARSNPFTVTVEEREPLVLAAPATLSLKRFSTASFVATTADSIPPVSYAVTPDLPAGLTLDTSTGAITGSSNEIVPATVYTLTATDSKGGELGTDTAQFTLLVEERDPLGIDGPESYVFAQHFEGSVNYAAVNLIGPARFSISPGLPAGLSLDAATGVISGTTSEKSDPAQYMLTVEDDHDSSVKAVVLSVGDRLPLGIATPEHQNLLLGHDYVLSLSAKNSVGPVMWEHVVGDLPAGIAFDAATGTFSGTPTEFDVTSQVTIRATDGFDGLAERTFIFDVLQDGTPITLSAEGATTRVGEPFAIPTPVAGNVVGEPVWTADTGTTGLVVDRKTGKLTGTPSEASTSDVTLAVTDATGRQATKTITVVSAPRIAITAPSALALTFNYDAPAGAKAKAIGNVGTVTWTLSGAVPQWLSLDPATGAFLGRPTEIGTFGPVFVTAVDSLPGATTSGPVIIEVAMNSDPIELAVTDFVTKVGHQVATAAPTYGNNLGPVTFFSTDLSGTGLTIDPATGVLSGTALEVADRFINVSVRDRDTARVTSRPLRYQVLPEMQVTLPSQVILSALTDIAPVAPTRNYVVGEAVWEDIDQSAGRLPEGIVFDAETGTLRGNAKEIGTFGPFTVASTDSVGDRGVSNSFTIKVNPGAYFLGLASADPLPDAVKRIEEYSYDFKQHLTHVGMDESEIAWSLGSGSPPGLTIANGVLSGTPTLSGSYAFDVIAEYGTIEAKRSYTLVVNLPETSIVLTSAELPQAKRRLATADNSYSFDFKSLLTTTNIGSDNVVLSVEPFATTEGLPSGLALIDGALTGVADDAPGIYSFTVKAQFTDATDENVSVTTPYTLELVDDVVIGFNERTMTAATKRLPYSFDLGSLIDETELKGITKEQLSWSWELDPGRDQSSTMSELPNGLSITGTAVTGTPVNSGIYDLILTASFDGRAMSRSTRLAIDLPEIGLAIGGDPLPSGVRDEAYSFDLATKLDATNIPSSEVSWTASADVTPGSGEIAGLPPGMSVTPGGRLSGTPSAAGTYRFKVSTSWSDANAVAEAASKSAALVLAIAGPSYDFADVAVGQYFSCGVLSTGKVKCWGLGSGGRLGNGNTNAQYLPVDTVGITDATKIAAGGQHACALTSSGTVKCWGVGSSGQLGNSSTFSSNVPVDVKNLANAVDITAGWEHTCALTSAGAVKCWGDNSTGQLGNGQTGASTVPVETSGLSSGVVEVSGGGMHTCARLQDGSAKCWGRGTSGQLGNGGGSSLVPVAVNSVGSPWKSISAGYLHTCGVTDNGSMFCWGYNQAGQLGNGTTSTASNPIPTQVTGLTANVRQASAGHYYSCAVMDSGTAKCWGQNGVGRLGTGTWDATTTPQDVVNLSGVAAFSASYSHACAATSTGTKCWGQGSYGQLGNGGTANSHTPVNVGG